MNNECGCTAQEHLSPKNKIGLAQIAQFALAQRRLCDETRKVGCLLQFNRISSTCCTRFLFSAGSIFYFRPSFIFTKRIDTRQEFIGANSHLRRCGSFTFEALSTDVEDVDGFSLSCREQVFCSGCMVRLAPDNYQNKIRATKRVICRLRHGFVWYFPATTFPPDWMVVG
jgi:hypothetical protein